MKDTTDKQQRILDYICRFKLENDGNSPSMREIAGKFGITVKGAYDHLQVLKKKGKISLSKNISRSISVIGPAKDVTSSVSTGEIDGDQLSLLECVCGEKFSNWDFVLSSDPLQKEEDLPSCPKCGRKFYFRSTIRVYCTGEDDGEI